MAKPRVRSSKTAPPSKSEPVTDPNELERLKRIFAFGELLSKAFPGRLKPRISVTHPQGAALTWSMDQIMRLKKRAERGRSIPWEATGFIKVVKQKSPADVGIDYKVPSKAEDVPK